MMDRYDKAIFDAKKSLGYSEGECTENMDMGKVAVRAVEIVIERYEAEKKALPKGFLLCNCACGVRFAKHRSSLKKWCGRDCVARLKKFARKPGKRERLTRKESVELIDRVNRALVISGKRKIAVSTRTA